MKTKRFLLGESNHTAFTSRYSISKPKFPVSIRVYKLLFG